MPGTQNNSGLDARRFAALLAGFDLGNGSEEEAISKGRALRRMAANAGVRIVDLLELPDVKKAVDEQMQPRREESTDLKEAQERAALLEDELRDRMQDVTNLAELLRQEKETSESLRQRAGRPGQGGNGATASSPSFGVPSWGFEAGTVLLAVVLMIAAFIGGKFREGGNGNGMGKREGNVAAVVRQGGTVRAVPKRRVLPDRQHRGGAIDRSR
jgi:hypothetical protein